MKESEFKEMNDFHERITTIIDTYTKVVSVLVGVVIVVICCLLIF